MSKILSRIDEAFSEKNADHYELSLLISNKTFSMSVFDLKKEKYLLLESFSEPFFRIGDADLFLKAKWKSTRIIIENNVSTLIPVQLLDQSKLKSYLSITVDLSENEKFFFNRLQQSEICNVFAVAEEMANEIDVRYPQQPLFHLSTILIDGIWMNYKNHISGIRIFIYMREEDFHLIIFNKKQLIFSNAYHILTPEDFIYYVIFVMEQLDLNPEETPVTLMGKISNDSRYYELLYQYIRHIDFISRNETSHFSYVFDDIPGHHFFPLLNPVK